MKLNNEQIKNTRVCVKTSAQIGHGTWHDLLNRQYINEVKYILFTAGRSDDTMWMTYIDDIRLIYMQSMEGL